MDTVKAEELEKAAHELYVQRKALLDQALELQRQRRLAQRGPVTREEPKIELLLFDGPWGKAWSIGRQRDDRRPALASLRVDWLVGRNQLEAAFEALEAREEEVRLFLPRDSQVHWAVREAGEIRILCHACHGQEAIKGSCDVPSCGNYEVDPLLRRRRA